MPICFVVHLFITIVNDGYLSHSLGVAYTPIILFRVFSTRVVELRLALVHTTASDTNSIVRALNNN